MNILYIHSHDTGRHIQPYGHTIATPRLQQLAEQGVLFRKNFCVNPTCSPSRAALLTGCYPHENGMFGLTHRGWALNDYSKHLVSTLKVNDYHTAMVGIQHVASSTVDKEAYEVIGYDQELEGEQTEAAVSFFENPPEKPFFLSVGFAETHRAFPALEHSDANPNYCLPAPPLPDTPETRTDMARYKASAQELDRKMGVVFDALEKSGLADQTLVICTTDHGIAFPSMKCSLQDHGIGTFLIMRGPGGFQGGRVVDAMTSHLDIFPTICDLLTVKRPEWLQGESLLPLVNGTVNSMHSTLFFEVNYHSAYQPMRAVRTDRWKYIRRYYDDTSCPVLPNCDRGESKDVWLANDWARRPDPEEALYDLVFDPGEMNNLVASAAHMSILEDLREHMRHWMESTNDPLLFDGIPIHEGVTENDRYAASSHDPVQPAKQHTLPSTLSSRPFRDTA